MRKSGYAIGALIDPIGRVAVCSELINAQSLNNKYSLSVERYLDPEENPEQALIDQMKLQLGIKDTDIEDLSIVASSVITHGMNQIATCKVHVYVFKFEKAVTMTIDCPDRNPLEFCDLNTIVKVFKDRLITLSFCGEYMLKFLKSNKYVVLSKSFKSF